MNAKPIILEGLTQKEALEEAAKQFQVPVVHLQTEKLAEKKFKISVLCVPGKMSFRVSADKMQVILEEFHPATGVPIPFEEEWSRGLAEVAKLKIKFGFDEKALEQAIKNCLANKSPIRHVEIARGHPPEKGTDAEIEKFFELQAGKETKELSRETAMPGDVLIVKKLPQRGKTGKNVFSEIVPDPAAADIAIQCGANIEARNIKISGKDSEHPIEAVEYVSKAYGKISFQKNKLEVVPAVLLSEDRMTARMDLIRCSCRGTLLSFAHLQTVLANAKISVGILEKEVTEKIAKLIEEETNLMNVCVARGIPAHDGANGDAELLVHHIPEPLTKKVSGLVIKGQRLLEILKPTKATPGSDVTGKRVDGKDGEDYEIEALDGIETRSYEHSEGLVASMTGYVTIDLHKIEVVPAAAVDEDEMRATCDFYPKMVDGTPATKDFFLKALAECQVSSGIRTSAIEEALASVVATDGVKRRVVVAVGEEEVNGRDGRLETLWTSNKFMLPKPFVRKGELIAVLHGPTKGKIGRTVMGKELRATDGAPYRFSCEAGTVAEIIEAENKTLIRATKYGVIDQERDDRISVDWELEVSKDEMHVYGDICRKSFSGATVHSADIFEELKDQKIIFGHRERAIREFLHQTDNLFVKHFLLAEGLEPKQGSGAYHKFVFSFNDISEDQLEKAPLSELKARRSLELVTRGEALIRVIQAGKGVDGSNVMGVKIPGPVGEPAPEIELGENVRFEEDRHAFVSTLEPVGYVDFTQKKLSVFPPLRVSDDKISAAVSIYPATLKANGQTAKMLNLQDIARWIEALKIKAEADFIRFMDLCEQVAETKKPVLDEPIVHGLRPADGENEEVKLLVKASKKAGRLRNDQTMDLRERDAILNVKAGDEILSVSHATHGSSGTDIFGNPIPPVDGKVVEFTAGDNVQGFDTESGYKLLAKISGTLIMAKNSCSIIQTYLVDGDVNFNVGNINNKEGGVVVRGSVMPDFSVSGSQDVIIEEMVENAKVSSGERVVVMGSVLGKSTEITAKGVIEVGVINKAKLISYSKIQIRSESYLAQVISDDTVTIENSSGRVAGGLIEAFNKISVPQCGSSEFSVDTQLSVGRMFATEKEVDALMIKENIAANIRKLQSAKRALSVQLRDMKQAEGERKPEELAVIEKLQADLDKIDHALAAVEARKKELLARIKENPEATIEVNGKVYPGTTIRILGKTLLIRELLTRVRFSLDLKEDRIVHEPL